MEESINATVACSFTSSLLLDSSRLFPRLRAVLSTATPRPRLVPSTAVPAAAQRWFQLPSPQTPTAVRPPPHSLALSQLTSLPRIRNVPLALIRRQLVRSRRSQ